MPAPQRYLTPHQQLYEIACAARQQGLSFDEWWDRAVPPVVERSGGLRSAVPLPRVGDEVEPGVVVWPRDTRDRQIAYDAAREAKEGWRRAYDREPPTRGERSLARLAPVFGALESRGSSSGTDVDFAAA